MIQEFTRRPSWLQRVIMLNRWNGSVTLDRSLPWAHPPIMMDGNIVFSMWDLLQTGLSLLESLTVTILAAISTMIRRLICYLWQIAAKASANTSTTMTEIFLMEPLHLLLISTNMSVNLHATVWLFCLTGVLIRRITSWLELSDSTENKLNSYLLKCLEDTDRPRISPRYQRLIPWLTKNGRLPLWPKATSTKILKHRSA